MTPHDAPVALEELLAHREWVRGLALALTRDEHDAADVEQATWLAAVRHPPEHRESLRGWLGTAVRRAAGKLRRSRTRRRAAEERLGPAAAGSAADDVAELAERADLHRRVVQAVVALDEPYRGTLLLRFFEGLSVAEVAARTRVPLETTRARLRRGIATLRARLEDECGGRDAWMGAAALLVGTERPAVPAGSAAAAAGGMAMATKAWLVAAALLACGGAAVWALSRPPERAVAVVPTEIATVATAPPKPVERPQPPRAERPAPPAPAAEAPVDATSPAEPERPKQTAKERLEGMTLSVTWQGTSQLAWLGELSERTGIPFLVDRAWFDEQRRMQGGGALEVENVSAARLLRTVAKLSALRADVQESRVVLQREGQPDVSPADLVPVPTVARGPDGKPLRFVVAVLDESGGTVAGAAVWAEGETQARGTTDAAGEFSMERAIVLPRFFARAAGRMDSPLTPVAETAAPGARTELRLRGEAAHLTGVLRTRDGRPVAGARGLLVAALQPTGDEPPQHGYAPGTDGTFDDPSAPPGTATLRFSAKGFAKSATPVVLTAGRTTNVEITLIPESSCRGTVRDGKGDPVRGRRVTAAPVGSTTPVAAAVSNATGEFVLAGLAAGRFVISVVGTPGKPAAETTLELAEGETATWDPVVDTAGPPK